MKKILLIQLFLISFSNFIYSQKNADKQFQTASLPNGWSITKIGNSLPLGDLPLNMVVSHSKKLIAVTNNGQSIQSLELIDPIKEIVLDKIIVPKLWYGLKFSADDKFLYASGGNDNRILKYQIRKNHLILIDSLLLGKAWPNKISPSGIDLDDGKGLLYVVT